MSHSAALLRLLEPTVRRVSPSGAVSKIGTQAPGAGQAPFEHQDFATLLASSKQETTASQNPDAAPQAPNAASPAGPLDLLADVGRIENPGLRDLLASIASTTKTTDPDFNAPPTALSA